MIWSMFQAIFKSFCNHDFFVKLNLRIFLALVRQREKSQKYFSLSALIWNLSHSNLCSTASAMNIQKWELFSCPPGKK